MEKALDQADDVPIESKVVSKAIERAQKQVEAQNFSIRKRLLEYDDVQNLQRKEVYNLRREILDGDETREYVMARVDDLVDSLLDAHLLADEQGGPQIDEFEAQVLHHFGFSADKEGVHLGAGRDEVREALLAKIHERYEEKEARVGAEMMRRYERFVVLQMVDGQWKDHLLALDHLKEGISLRAYAQRDPLIEYKRESYELFASMKERLEDEIVRYLMLLEPMTEEERAKQEELRRRERDQIFRAASAAKAGEKVAAVKTVRRTEERVGRNSPCPCGSGKKYKKCCGAASAAGR
ncbi:MAG: SEC-C metal-binding domain-containing protein [Acidobacteriota bacterium]|nr:SEC-C metal-binding domain-containing protein [Acidobacteriota bacterium]